MSFESQKPARPRRIFVLLPLLIFLALAGLFLVQLLSGRDLTAVPSALIGQTAPKTELPPLEGLSLPGLNSAEFTGKVTLVNVWASWCAPCREEHPVLLELSKDQRFSIAGLNYKDKPENARRFLGDLGNPFKAVGVDQNGRTAIDWGVYGVPETFLVGKDGKVAFKHVGPLSPEAVTATLMPAIEKALAAQ
ncbi:DsbE family thiol:disulfide interchange protein [Aminobacter carboxidus]|uniref:Cytochrome c biogenesis protein CcmG/thiol:disulfide interchange protein DsbE n=1 Tax=Aminobacter carboxidus TaxID=376165 RepID=A0A8E2BC34_9HYPH|nr:MULTISPECIES: DsbE family thiol:disulfide interchange protein [Aminobacter carboxidus group]MBB6465774.1 cytochrome c biogenesis protein CcmG/thiol:disulfide interchange protein DsbE [Aminobacter lissarensis]MBE1204487.1 DsbE family thiol:disulfide interchange protein [Aminobacter carboxidus]